MTGSDEIGERQYAPAVAAWAVGRDLVLVFKQAGEGAEVNRGATLGRGLAHDLSLRLSLLDRDRGLSRWSLSAREPRGRWL